jgi:mannose-6-phosphate isomerase-like protein (cupin superfamily)
MVMPVRPFAVLSNEGKTLKSPTGSSVTVKADTKNTNGSLTVLEMLTEPKDGPALHTHLREDELWWVLEGEYRFKLGDAIFSVSQGGMAFGPRGTPHNYQNVGDTQARLLVITTPSGLERFFEQFAEVPPGPVDRDRIASVGQANWIDFVGPPLSVTDPL